MKREVDDDDLPLPVRAKAQRIDTKQDTSINEGESATVSVASKLDKFLKSSFSIGGKAVGLALKSGRVSVNGSKETKGFLDLKVGDVVRVIKETVVTQPKTFLFESKHIAIMWKLPGTAVKSLDIPSDWIPFTTLDTATQGLVILAKNEETFENLRILNNKGLISETWTCLCTGNVSAIRSLKRDETFELDHSIDGVADEPVSLCTFLDSSRTKNYESGWISVVLVSPIQDFAPVPLQPLNHLQGTEHPVLDAHYIALTGIDFEFDGKPVGVALGPPEKFKSFIKKEHEAWRVKRDADIKELKKGGVGVTESVEKQLDAGVPIPYILGLKTFCGHQFHVTPSVMIPKIGTETLIQSLLQTHATVPKTSASPQILDLGTGSGCILLTLLMHPLLQNATGLGIDISSDALKVAEMNRKRHNLTHRATFLESSFEQIPNVLDSTKPVKYILTNPPYLPKRLYDSDRIYASQRHEPSVALLAGEDGLDAYREIFRALGECGRKGVVVGDGTVLFVEVNNGELADAVKRIFLVEGGGWRFERTDVDGKGLQRCVVFRWSI
ncbi:S-adenosyl-L-methionine-dependent methyltransferase [Rhizoclosmatium globosum]|uniref:S-adenosyl-L-methionine-dependent methyltransferase n=1 Tax=Rhizoclosmatium globosum TaxID=329046 RepID=A0A1Y2CRA5_9FUNG|nr:S-adenosyl-L-methionine-dependent methyltransferase [Rhizoclosmatium globosum]|eukprot:ORY49486.1 S-adenosyl-L-methionine-dependent methyltransferase [Rhizoclosmatium globosum]